MKKEERKQRYRMIMNLMLDGDNKKAFDELACMCGADTGLFLLADYDAVLRERQQAQNHTAQAHDMVQEQSK